ncbi:MAG: hypothetical protein JXA87_08240, partial [Thermoleophilia bacterium]|nr:hypothetical protein [Thermoleophilia bacterium]
AVSIDRLQLTVDPAGYRTLVMQAIASDNEKLAAGLNDMRGRITQAVDRLNQTQGALIALVVIDIDSPDGKPLHRSSLDWQLKMEGYWNDPAVQALLPDGRLDPVGPGV